MLRQVVKLLSQIISLAGKVGQKMLICSLQQYETDSNVVRGMFEEHGEVKTFFDLISNRGMVFVTYVSEIDKKWRNK